MSHSSETIEVPYLFETEAQTTTNVNLHMASETPAIKDIEVPPPVEKKVTASASTELSVHTGERFPKGPNDYYAFTGYFDHVAFRLWKGAVCI